MRCSGHLRWGVGSTYIHPGVWDLGIRGSGCMYILYIYPRVRAVGFSTGPNTPISGVRRPRDGGDNGPNNGGYNGPYRGCIYSI